MIERLYESLSNPVNKSSSTYSDSGKLAISSLVGSQSVKFSAKKLLRLPGLPYLPGTRDHINEALVVQLVRVADAGLFTARNYGDAREGSACVLDTSPWI